MRLIALPLICVTVACVAATAATARTDARAVIVVTTGPTAPLATGIGDPVYATHQAATAYAMTHRAGATYARLIVKWNSIGPGTFPVGGFTRSDPKSPYYHWKSLDASVLAANAAHMTPILDIIAPPAWAYAVPKGVWTGGSPKLAELHGFAAAIAKHFDGHAPAPVAHIFSVWNEPNYNKNLYPQNAGLYRSMVNTVADAVHTVDPSDLVAAGELAPAKHAPTATDKNHVIPPLDWMRSMFCLSNTTPVHRTCTTQVKIDVWTHHPYSDTGPYGHSRASGGVELGDLQKMDTLLKKADQLGAIDSAQPVQFWVTEFGWSSNPPNVHGAPLLLEARWLAESMYQIWRTGATLGTWFLIQDRQPGTPFQSGLYFRSPTLAGAPPKPLVVPFRFPFVAYLKSSGNVFVWGRDTTSNLKDVTIQERKREGGPWSTVATVKSNSYGIFQATLHLGASSSYDMRATAVGSGISRVFALKVPFNENLRVTPFPHN
jgi:hypothetical protein